MNQNLWYIYTREYYAAERKEELLPFGTAWMELESIMLSEICQARKDKYHMISLLTGTSSKKRTSKQSIAKDIEIENRLTVIRRERGGDNGGKGERDFRNNYKGHMDKTKRWGGIWGGWLVWGGSGGGKCRQLYFNSEVKKKKEIETPITA